MRKFLSLLSTTSVFVGASQTAVNLEQDVQKISNSLSVLTVLAALNGD
jgi:hypothetical protein